jgi:hypothetical protein
VADEAFFTLVINDQYHSLCFAGIGEGHFWAANLQEGAVAKFSTRTFALEGWTATQMLQKKI